MVYAVCRRVLCDTHAADDAFQATFLVLARRAESLKREGPLAGWLYAVAYRTSLKARAQAARRLAHEKQVRDMIAEPSTCDQAWREFLPALDEELGKLPEKYRLPVVLCYLEGKTHQQAARELGWPSGSMSRRMSRALDLLRNRLQSRGVALPGVMLLGFLVQAGRLRVPEVLVSSTAHGAVAFGAGSATVLADSVLMLAREVLRSLSRRAWRLWELWLLLALGAFVGGSSVAAAVYFDLGSPQTFSHVCGQLPPPPEPPAPAPARP